MHIAEQAAHHDRALKAVHSGEQGTNTLLADSLRGFLLLEVSSLSGSEQVKVYTGAAKSYRYTDIYKALRDTWGNDSRLQAHDQHLAMEMQAGLLTGAAHTETVHDSFFGSGEGEWFGDDWAGYDDYHSVGDSRAAHGDSQEKRRRRNDLV